MIHDKFSKLKISRQRKYQLRRKARKLCSQCGYPAMKWGLCVVCAELSAKNHATRYRKTSNPERRYHSKYSVSGRR
jgi:hypothetical protein